MVKKGKIVAFFLFLIILIATISLTVKDITKDIKLGLDLQGGFEVLYEVKPQEEGQKITKEVLNDTVSALYKRINVLGVSEPNIQIEGENRIRVQLAGVTDQNQARKILSTQANLTFRDIEDKVLLRGNDLKEGGASLTFDQLGKPAVALTLKSADKFGKVTKEVYEKGPGQNLLVIWLDFEEDKDSFMKELAKEDPKYLSSPQVNKVLNTKDVLIEGDFTKEEAQELADLLNAGALPVQLNEIYSTSVGAQFGENALKATTYAALVGITIIFLFMLFFYRLPGVISILSLATYVYLILLVFNLMGAVLTLPGIAALVLGVGMAVDANIITAERIKEELRLGKSIRSGFRDGNKHSFSSIFDANITTIIAAAALFAYGTSSVKGFATMLLISVVLSFFTAVFLSRWLLGLWVNSGILKKKIGLFGVKESEIDR